MVVIERWLITLPDGQPAVVVVDIDPPLLPGEVEVDLTDRPRWTMTTADLVALLDLESRCCGGGVSGGDAA